MIRIEIASELIETGRDPIDQEILIGERFCVRATAVNGRRWEHEHAWTAGLFCSGADEEGWPTYRRVEAEGARAAAQRLADAVKAALANGRRLNLAHWVEVYPEYGSPAYEVAEADIVLAERQRDRDSV